MVQKDEISLLERYARLTNNKVLTSQADLDPKDRVSMPMAAWCAERGNIVVLLSGMILTCVPTSRVVHNCKTIMLNKGLKPGRVRPATRALIDMLLANVEYEEKAETENTAQAELKKRMSTVSGQQQRLRTLVDEAMRADVSDIHIEVRTDVAKIRFRKHGELYLHAEWFPRMGREIASVAFNKETDHATQHFNPLIPQNASMPLQIDSKQIRLRLASMPAHGGFDMVMRLLGTGEVDEHKITLEELGYTAEQVYIIRRAVQMPHGAVLLAGPTGSGKTTTLAACMNLVNPTRKLYTIEDPVEKVVEHVTQVPVNTEQDDRSFASFGRACLRMDPDYIILGEMRDEDTANVMVRASITGHLVFSTIHTNSAPGIVTRLVDMGISPTLLADGQLLVALICQRLVAKLCEDCSVSIDDSKLHQPHEERLKAAFGDCWDKVRVRGQNKECEACHGTGVGGRRVVAEVIWVDDRGREFIHKEDTFGWERYLRQQGWQDHHEHALALVRQGLVDPFDAEKIVGEINPKFTRDGFDYRSIMDTDSAASPE